MIVKFEKDGKYCQLTVPFPVIEIRFILPFLQKTLAYGLYMWRGGRKIRCTVIWVRVEVRK